MQLGSRRSLVGVAALLGAMGVIALFAILSGAPPVMDRPNATPRDADGSKTAPARGAAAAAEGDRHRVAVPAEDGARTPTESGTPTKPPGAPLATIRVRVIDKATREGCPKAEVLFSTDPRILVQSSDEVEARLRALGGSVHADDEGFAAIRLLPGVQRIAAWAGGRYGELQLEREPVDGFCIEVERDVELRVRAVNAKGERCPGIPITALWLIPHHTGVGTSQASNPVGTTGEKGELAFRHAQARCWNLARDANGRRTVRFAITFQGADVPQPGADLDDPPKDALEVLVPETGRVQLEAREANGAPVLDQGWMAIAPTGTESQLGRLSGRAEAGIVILPQVPLGRTWNLEAIFAPRHVQQTIEGPRVAGETTVARITLPPVGLAISGRALDSEGKPLARRQLFCTIGASGKASMPRWVETDADGRFRWWIDERLAGQPCDVTSVELMTGPPASARTGVMAKGPILAQPVAGDNEIGDLLLAPAPTLARIRFVVGDVDGDSGLQLDVAKRVAGASTAETAWAPAFEASVLRIDARHFEIRGGDTLRRVKIHVSSPAHQRVPDLEVDLPAPREIEIALARAGSMIAQIRLEGLPQYLMQSTLWAIRTDPSPPVDANSSAFGVLTRSNEGRHDYLWERLTSGTYRVELHFGKSARVLAAVDDVVVRAGEQTRDPRLLPIEWPQTLRSISVRLRDAEGKPLEDLNAHGEILGPGGEPASGFAWEARDQIKIVTTEAWVDLRVTAQGYRPASLERLARDAEITLRAGPRLRVVLQGERPTLSQGWQLLAGMRAGPRREPGAGGPFDQVSPLDEAGSVSWPLSSGGEVYVELGLSIGWGWRPVASATITVPDGAKEHRHELAIDPERLRAALEGPGR